MNGVQANYLTISFPDTTKTRNIQIATQRFLPLPITLKIINKTMHPIMFTIPLAAPRRHECRATKTPILVNKVR